MSVKSIWSTVSFNSEVSLSIFLVWMTSLWVRVEYWHNPLLLSWGLSVLLKFLLRNLLLFCWLGFICDQLLLFCSFQYSFFCNVLIVLFNGEHLLWSYMFTVLKASWTWKKFLSKDRDNFLLLLYWICYLYIYLPSLLLLCPWFIGLVFQWWLKGLSCTVHTIL
jgi:hypothetical protein